MPIIILISSCNVDFRWAKNRLALTSQLSHCVCTFVVFTTMQKGGKVVRNIKSEGTNNITIHETELHILYPGQQQQRKDRGTTWQ